MALSVFGRGWPQDPFTELRRMQAEMDQLLSRYDGPVTAEFPLVNLWTSPEDVVFTARLPGVDKDAVDLTIQNDTLTLRGQRGGEDEGGAETVYHRRERPRGTFARTIVLPFEVEADSAEAMFSDGVLAVRLKRPEAERPRRINITER